MATWADPTATWADSTATWGGGSSSPPVGATWADPTATWADPTITWTGGDSTEPEPDPERRRTNFLVGWYFDQQEPFYEVVDWVEGRSEPFV